MCTHIGYLGMCDHHFILCLTSVSVWVADPGPVGIDELKCGTVGLGTLVMWVQCTRAQNWRQDIIFYFIWIYYSLTFQWMWTVMIANTLLHFSRHLQQNLLIHAAPRLSCKFMSIKICSAKDSAMYPKELKIIHNNIIKAISTVLSKSASLPV